MKTGKLKTLLVAVVSGIIVLAGCNADDKAPATGNAPVEDKDIIIMITSPIVDNLYSRVDPPRTFSGTGVRQVGAERQWFPIAISAR